MSRDANGCGTKHLKLGLWIVGTFLAILCSVGLAALGYEAGKDRDRAATLAAQDARIRQNEQSRAASEARYDEIKRSLERIERQLEKGKTP